MGDWKMYDIVTLEPDDKIVMAAVNAIVKGEGAIPGPKGNYRFIARNGLYIEGDGGNSCAVLVVVGHGNADSISGCDTWSELKQRVGGDIDWKGKQTVYIVACSTYGEDGSKFLHGNIASEIKQDFPNATVWASASAVSSSTQSGDWHKL